MNLVKKTTAILVVALLAAAPAFSAVEGGNAKKGKYLFKKTCKSCHGAGGEGGDLTPMSKTMGQWERFAEKSEGCAQKAKLSGKDMQDVNQFLYDHAVDSDQPETCG